MSLWFWANDYDSIVLSVEDVDIHKRCSLCLFNVLEFALHFLFLAVRIRPEEQIKMLCAAAVSYANVIVTE